MARYVQTLWAPRILRVGAPAGPPDDDADEGRQADVRRRWMIHTCMAYRCYYQEEFWRGRPLSEPDQTAIAGLERHPSRHRPASEACSDLRVGALRFRFGNRSIKTYSVNKGEIKSPFYLYNSSLVGLHYSGTRDVIGVWPRDYPCIACHGRRRRARRRADSQ